MIISQLVAQMESRFGPVEETGVEPQDWEALVKDALERVKEWARSEGHEADFIRQDSIPLGVEGEVAIPSDMLSGRVTRVNHPNSTKDFVKVPDRASLAFIAVNEIGHYCIDAGKVWSKLGGDFPTGNLLVSGVFSATLGTLPSKIEPYFFREMAELAQERLHIDPLGAQDEQPGAQEMG